MKKRILGLLLVCSLCVGLWACRWYQKGKTFSQEILQQVSLEAMPLPESDNYSLNSMTAGRETLTAEITREEYNAYVEAFADYMRERTDIYYFGLQESNGLIGEMLPHRVVCEVSEDFACTDDRTVYRFSYSLREELSDSAACEHACYAEFFAVEMDYIINDGKAKITIYTDPAFGDCIDEVLAAPYVFKLDFSGEFYSIAGVRRTLSGEVTLPETYKGLPVRELASWGFSVNGSEVASIDGVTKIIIPDCYTVIGYKAFDKMANLTSVVIGNGVESIGAAAFENCPKLETVVFGNSIQAIWAQAFQNCEKLTNVVLPDSLLEIAYRAFAFCSSIETVVIPEGVIMMGPDVFYDNESLTDIYCEAEAPGAEWDTGWCGNEASYLANNDVKVTFGYGGDSPVVHYSVSFDTIGSYKPVFLEKFSYLRTVGSEVTFYLSPVDGTTNAAMYINGEYHSVGIVAEVPEEGGDGLKTLWKYTFTMPEEHIVISFQPEDKA